MEEIVTEHSRAVCTPINAIMRQAKTVPCQCKICGGPARYSYYGAVVCYPCKMFFKRNAVQGQSIFKCTSGNECGIDIRNRRVCSSCRLAKCFTNGMCADMIRSPLFKKNEESRKRKLIHISIPLISPVTIKSSKKNQLEEIPTLNLLQPDQSSLSINQWNLLSGLVHCFDKNSGYSFVEQFIDDQNALPIKLRFKYASVTNFFTSVMGKVQLVFEKNRDCLSLSSHDRTNLLRNTIEYNGIIGGMFLLRQTRLLDDVTFFTSAEIIFHSSTMILIKRIIDLFDTDDTFSKIILATLAFTSINYTVYKKNVRTNLTNIKAILPIQDMYTELAWRYLLHKYGEYQAVIRFSKLIRCLLLVNDAIVEAHESQQYAEIIDSVIEQTEQALSL